MEGCLGEAPEFGVSGHSNFSSILFSAEVFNVAIT